MFECTVELLSSFGKQEAQFFVVGRYLFDIGLQVGDEVEINGWKIWHKMYTLKAKVVQRKREIFPPNSPQLIEHGDDAVKNGLFALRVFVEAEDRDAIIEICEAIEEGELRLKSNIL